jgi:hypothetical protein
MEDFLFVHTRDIGYRIDTTHSMAREAELLLLLLCRRNDLVDF